MSFGDVLLNPIKPLARTAKLRMLKRKAEHQLRTNAPATIDAASPPPVFIFACGRSGTTILGKLLAIHPQVVYLREPYHLWATIEPALDVTNLHVREQPRLWWGGDDATDRMRERFARLILAQRTIGNKPILIEKTPHNVYRVGLIEALTNQRARYIHIVRDGVDVARSIDRLASNQPYKMAFRSDYNQWWGSNNLKWQRLAVEGPAHGHFSSDLVSQLTANDQRGAYEWLTSLGEAARWGPLLGDRFLEITYSQLTGDPQATLGCIAGHINAEVPESWLASASSMLSPERKNQGKSLCLPVPMAEQFNVYQAQHQFSNQAQPITP